MRPSSLTDTHCHLNSPVFNGRVDEVVARAVEAGVERIIVPGWDEESSLTALALADRFPQIRPAVGLHPWFVGRDPDLTWLINLLDDPRVAAVGEIGLDWEAEWRPRVQENVLRAELSLAKERNLPVLLHCRRGWDRMLACLRDFRVRAVAHAYSGSLETMREGLKLGLYFSFAGMVTRRNSKRAQEAARAVPADRLLLETDAPYMALEGIPADRTEPAHVQQVLAFIAALRGVDPEELATQVAANTQAFLGIS